MSTEEYVKSVKAVCNLVTQLWDTSASFAQYRRVAGLRRWPKYQDAPYIHPKCKRPSFADFWKVEFVKLEGVDREGDPLDSVALTGAAFSLSNSSPEVQRALLMHNQCDMSWVAMRGTLTRLLHTIDREIRVEPVYVFPNPRIHLQEIGRKTAAVHSVLNIITAQGSFVLDLSGEQYGFPRHCLFLSEEDYKRQCVVSKADCPSRRWFVMEQNEIDQTINTVENTFNFYENRFWHVTKAFLNDEVSEWEKRIQGEARTHSLLSEGEIHEIVELFQDKMRNGDMSRWSKQWT